MSNTGLEPPPSEDLPPAAAPAVLPAAPAPPTRRRRWVPFQDRDQAWQEFQKDFKDEADLVAGASREEMPESYRLKIRTDDFDCRVLQRVKSLPGFADVTVARVPQKQDARNELVRVSCF